MLPANELEAEALLALYQPIVGVRLNIAVSATGSVAGESGSSDDVSNPLDRLLLGELRKQSDVIVTSGATARAENLRASKLAEMVVLSHSGSLKGLERLLTTVEARPVTIVVPQEIVANANLSLSESRLSAKVVGLTDLKPTTVLAYLHRCGFRKILLEFGPRLAQLWSRAGVIDEVCLTTSAIGAHIGPNARPASANLTLPNFITSAGPKTLTDFYSPATDSRFQRVALA